MNVKLLSLVVPAYKQEKTIVKDLKNIESAISALSCPYEIIVVVDGFSDRTFEKVKSIKNKKIRVIGYEKNTGKGFAVRQGILKAKGDVIGFIDAGMDLDPSEISIMLDLMEWNNADVIVGSKLHPESQVNYPTVRKILSWGYRTFTHLLFGFSIKDTQVGFKLFKRKVALDVFPRLLVKRFAFDVETLAVAYSLGYKKIYEAPVRLDFSGISSITSGSFWRVIGSMLWDTMAVFYRIRILNYYKKNK